MDVAFIHVPKTGGSYLNQKVPSKYNPVKDRFDYKFQGRAVMGGYKSLGHCVVLDRIPKDVRTRIDGGLVIGDLPPKKKVNNIPFGFRRVVLRESLGNYEVFSIVRNPFSFLVSYAGHCGCGNWGYVGGKYLRSLPPNSQTLSHDFKLAKRGFDYFVRALANRENPWPSRKFLFVQFFSSDGEMIVDWILRQDNLDSDLEKMAKYYSFPYRKGKKARASKRRPKGLWNDGLIRLVHDTWGREVKLFGYGCSGVLDTGGRVDKSFIRYRWDTNVLTVGGVKFA